MNKGAAAAIVGALVSTLTVTGCAAPLTIRSEDGHKLHVGAGLTVDINLVVIIEICECQNIHRAGTKVVRECGRKRPVCFPKKD
jgi:hypothetical protein